MTEFWLGVCWGIGGLLLISALVIGLLIWRAPVIEADEHEGWGV